MMERLPATVDAMERGGSMGKAEALQRYTAAMALDKTAEVEAEILSRVAGARSWAVAVSD